MSCDVIEHDPRTHPQKGDRLLLPCCKSPVTVDCVAYGTVYYQLDGQNIGHDGVAIWKWQEMANQAIVLHNNDTPDSFWSDRCATCGCIRGQHYVGKAPEHAEGCPWHEHCHQFVKKQS